MKALFITLMILWLVNIVVYSYWEKKQLRKAIESKSSNARWMLNYRVNCFNWWFYIIYDTEALDKLGKNAWDKKWRTKK